MPSSQSYLQSEDPASELGFLSLMQRSLFGDPFIFLIPVLAAAVGVAVQGTTTPPSETHGRNLYVFILSTSIYAFAVATSCEHLGLVVFTSGFLSSVSMVSMVVPSRFWSIPFTVWALASVFVTYLQFKEMFNTLIMNIGGKIQDIWGWLKKMYRKMSRFWSNNEPELPVVNPHSQRPTQLS